MWRHRILPTAALFAALSAALLVAAPAAAGAGAVSYTWTLAALGQGGWVGGPLFADGTAGGGGALSVNNGQLIERFRPTTWSEPVDGVIHICLNVSQIKPAGGPSSTQCFDLPETGAPIKVTLFGTEHILRVTEVN
jgi:hypothetical protein